MMRITKVEIIPIKIPYREEIRDELIEANPKMGFAKTNIYKVFTDEGLIGIGEGQIDPEIPVNRYIGKQPFDFVKDDSSGSLLIAFYDLMGKSLGLPVYKLLGTPYRDKISIVYWSHSFTPELLASEARKALQMGFKVHKIKARPFRDTVSQVSAIAQVVPSDYRIIIDANETFGTIADTMRIIGEYRNVPQVWMLEEPIPTCNPADYRALRKKIAYPLAIHAKNKCASLGLGTCDAVVIEKMPLGRSVEKTAAVAEQMGRTIWLEYGLFTNVSAAFQLHQAAVISNVELCITLTFISEDNITTDSMVVQNGKVEVPQKPGLGIDLNEDSVEKYRI